MITSNVYTRAASVGSDGEDHASETEDVDMYNATFWVFANISGMITLLPDGTIHSINHNFALMLFGYSEEDLVGKVREKIHGNLTFRDRF